MGESPRKGSFAPPGLLAVRVCSHGSRHGLLSRAPPGLMPMKVTSKMYKLQERTRACSLAPLAAARCPRAERRRVRTRRSTRECVRHGGDCAVILALRFRWWARWLAFARALRDSAFRLHAEPPRTACPRRK